MGSIEFLMGPNHLLIQVYFWNKIYVEIFVYNFISLWGAFWQAL